jgi:protocatechuate 3,4-dioxygenase beta subunit
MRKCIPIITRAAAWAAAAVGGALAMMGAAAAEENSAAPPGTARIEVRGPDGRPLANAAVDVDFTGRDLSFARQEMRMRLMEARGADGQPPAAAADPLHRSLRTDDKGVLWVEWATGVCGCRIEVKGVGFGATGSVEIPTGVTAKVHLPPLAARAAIPKDAGVPLRTVFEPAMLYFDRPAAGGAGPRPPEQPAIAGKVVDTQGRPIAGATVMIDGEYFQNLHPGIIREQAVTDSEGRYHFAARDLPGSVDYLAVCACAADRPPAFVRGPPETAGGRAGAFDIIVPDKGGSLEVQVLAGGKPAGRAAVMLQPADLWQFLRLGGWSRGGPSDLVQSLRPTAVTDAGGVVRFENLLPGPYTVTAVAGGAQDDLDHISMGFWDLFGSDKPYGKAAGVLVAAAERRRVSVSIEARKPSIRMEVFYPNGRLAVERSVDMMYAQASQSDGTHTGRRLNNLGLADFSFPDFGLWRLRLRFRDTTYRVNPLTEEPFNQSETVVAVSPNLPANPITDFRAAARRTGSIEVALQDLDGKPVRGTVALAATIQTPAAYAGTTDDAGRILFTDLPSLDEYYVCPYSSLKPPPVPALARTDEELEGAAVYPAKRVAVKSNDTKLVVRQERLGYVRGKVKAADGLDLGKMELTIERPLTPEVLAYVVFDGKSGDFVAGPLQQGKTMLHLWYRGDDGPRDAGVTAVDVTGGKVTHADIAMPPLKDQRFAPRYAGELSVSGQVVLADGKTPAWAARVIRVAQGVRRPHSLGWTDAAGGFETRRQGWYGAEDQGETDPPGSPAEDVALAWLPGQCGAAFVPAGQGKDLRLVLPPAMKAEGRVTVGGKPASDYGGSIRVLARHEGFGKLDEWMSVSVTTNPEGSFVLYGLSPGAYTVQAALDDIWISDGVHVTVKDKDLDPIRLDIPVPGASAVLKIELAGGKSPGEVEVTVALPPGPLTDLLRPRSLRTDGTGRVLLAGLPAGESRLSIEGIKGEFKVALPAAAGSAPPELKLQAVEGQGGHLSDP